MHWRHGRVNVRDEGLSIQDVSLKSYNPLLRGLKVARSDKKGTKLKARSK